MIEMAEFEYGIRHKKSGDMHRTGMKHKDAIDFMDPEFWDGADPNKIFEIVHRPIGDWEAVE